MTTYKGKFPDIPAHFDDEENEIEDIQAINEEMRRKYLNRSECFGYPKLLEIYDKSFVTATTEDMVLYANLTPEDFGIASENFLEDTDNVFDSMLKESSFGIDHGYFLGSLFKSALDPTKNEVIQLKLSVPKGTKVTRVGPVSDSKYILQRERTFRYTEKTIHRDSNSTPYIEISAHLIDRKVLEDTTKYQEEVIGDTLKENFKIQPNPITIEPLGLNAGFVLSKGLDVAMNVFDNLDSGGILSKNLFDKEGVVFTSGWLLHTEIFTKMVEGLTLEERKYVFEQVFNPNVGGTTQPWPNGTSQSSITFSHLVKRNDLIGNRLTEAFSATFLHEFFHHLIHTTQRFKDRPMFQGEDPDAFKKTIEKLKDQEEAHLVELLKNRYATVDWEEFICEAFRAKFHAYENINTRFQKEVIRTNRFLDNLFDFEAPSTPKNLRELEVGGESVKIAFDHSNDNISVEKYNIYQDKGKDPILSIPTEKDESGLSPSKPEGKVEVSIENLEQVTDYEFRVSAVDEAQNESDKSNVLKVKTKDTEPPKLKGLFKGKALASIAARFNWFHPTDNVGVKEVKIRKQKSSSTFGIDSMGIVATSEEVFTVPGGTNHFTDYKIEKGKTYTYSMTALDEAGNESERSNDVVIQTNDNDDDKKNEDRAEEISSSNATLNWHGAFEGISASGFQLFGWVNGAAGWIFSGLTSVVGSASSFVVDLTPGLLHMFAVIPVDKEGNPLHDGLEISVEALREKLSAVAVNQLIDLGTDVQTVKYDNFVKDVKLGDKEISITDYTVIALNDVTTDIVGEQKATIRVTLKADPSYFVDIDVLVNVEWGNSTIAYGALGDGRTSVAFPLIKGDRLVIAAVSGLKNDNNAIHSYYKEKLYYKFDWFDLSKLSSFLMDENKNGNVHIEAMGDELKQNALKKWGTKQKQTVNDGDIVRAWQTEQKNWLYENGQQNEYHNGKKAVYYEITEQGYQPLRFNQLTPKEQIIESGMTNQELEKNVKNYLAVGDYKNIEVKKFVTYPDTSKVGKTTGVIQVEEILRSGKKIAYDYTVPFAVEPKKGTFQLVTALNDKSVVEINRNKYNVSLYENNGEKAQVWRFVYDEKKEVYQIESMNNPQLILAMIGDKPNRNEVWVRKNEYKEEDYWILEDYKDGYHLIKNKKNPEMVLTAYSTSNGAELFAWRKETLEAEPERVQRQKFKLVKPGTLPLESTILFRTFFQDGFKGMDHERAEIKSEQGENYAYLVGDSYPSYFVIKGLNLVPGDRYRLTYRGRGEGVLQIYLREDFIVEDHMKYDKPIALNTVIYSQKKYDTEIRFTTKPDGEISKIAIREVMLEKLHIYDSRISK